MSVLDPDALDRRDPRLVARLLPAFEAWNRHYLRLRVDGLEHIPRTPAIFVGNHNGGILGPDLTCTMAVLWRALGPATPLYALAHDFAMRHLPALGAALQLIGAVRASPENARRVLAAGGRVLVYPGGDLDAYRHFRLRDRVVLGERTGFVRIAQQAGVPLVPVVAQGAHRSSVVIAEGRRLARAIGLARWGRLERFPVTLGLPWGIGLGPWLPFLPLPFSIRLRILPPVTVAAGARPETVRDEVHARMEAAMRALAP